MVSALWALVALLLLAAAPAAAQKKTTKVTTRRWVTIWEDRFSDRQAPTGGTSKWIPQLGNGGDYYIPGWGNEELQVYTSDTSNLRLESVGGGKKHLVIEARYNPTAPEGQQFTSARIRTYSRFSVAPGPVHRRVRIEARLKATPGWGLWPAFWMLPEGATSAFSSGSGVYGDWATSGEIDIAELRNQMLLSIGSLHFGGQYDWNPANMLAAYDTPHTPNQWHTYAIEWEKERIRWFLDGKLFFTAFSGKGTCKPSPINPPLWCSTSPKAGPDSPFDQPMHILINMAVGGRFTYVDSNGDGRLEPLPKETILTSFAAAPPQLRVEYVRVQGCPAASFDEVCA